MKEQKGGRYKGAACARKERWKDGRADFWCTRRIRALALKQCWGLL